MLVGEIRDLETAEIAVQASLTGHLVLSTLHTNTAIGAITRLVDMGVEPFLISSSLLGIVAQRLVRRLCDECKEEHKPSEAEIRLLRLEALDVQPAIYNPKGCDKCEGTGYKGRFGIYELIPVTNEVREMVHQQMSEDQMLLKLRKTIPSLADDGFRRVLAGETSIAEVMRVTSA